MKVQTLSRTFIDKLFAVCDYYLLDRVKRQSRHLYDIYKLRDYVVFDDQFKSLIPQIREQRLHLADTITPSSRSGVDLVAISMKIQQSAFYEKDYIDSTLRLINENVPYKTVIDYFVATIKELFSKE